MKPHELPISVSAVSRETNDKLHRYHTLLLKWQEKINLISPNTVPEAWERHFVDSAQIAPLLPTDVRTLYDLGCGAGFPGLVLAIMLPDIEVTLIESDSKKCAFLQTVSRETGTQVIVRNERIEKVAQILPPPDIITARALAALSALLELSRPWLETGNPVFIFPKGRRYEDEVQEARSKGWKFDISEQRSITGEDSSILVLRNVSAS